MASGLPDDITRFDTEHPLCDGHAVGVGGGSVGGGMEEDGLGGGERGGVKGGGSVDDGSVDMGSAHLSAMFRGAICGDAGGGSGGGGGGQREWQRLSDRDPASASPEKKRKLLLELGRGGEGEGEGVGSATSSPSAIVVSSKAGVTMNGRVGGREGGGGGGGGGALRPFHRAQARKRQPTNRHKRVVKVPELVCMCVHKIHVFACARVTASTRSKFSHVLSDNIHHPHAGVHVHAHVCIHFYKHTHIHVCSYSLWVSFIVGLFCNYLFICTNFFSTQILFQSQRYLPLRSVTYKLRPSTQK